MRIIAFSLALAVSVMACQSKQEDIENVQHQAADVEDATTDAAANDSAMADDMANEAQDTPPAGAAMMYEVDFDEDQTLQFEGKDATGGSQFGTWEKWQVQATKSGEGLDTLESIVVTIDMPTVTTGIDQLTEHLKTPDFFDAETHQRATFLSRSIEPTDTPNQYMVKGTLTVRGTANEIEFPSMIMMDGDHLKAQAEITFSRLDYKLYAPGKTEDNAGDEVAFTYDVTLKPMANAQA